MSARKGVVLGFVALALLIVGAVYGTQTLDGIRGALLRPFFPDTTVRATGYSDSGYRRVATGADQTVVRGILGEPIERDVIKDIERWRYTMSGSDSHYRVRQISFKNGRVISKEHYYLVD